MEPPRRAAQGLPFGLLMADEIPCGPEDPQAVLDKVRELLDECAPTIHGRLGLTDRLRALLDGGGG